MNIKLEDIVKRFGTLEAVSHVSLDIKDGELFTLLGPSGCGKTTILRLVGGFHKPDHGEIYFGDREVSSLPPYERNIGMVFQNYALWPHMTIPNNIAYGLKLKKIFELRDRRKDLPRPETGQPDGPRKPLSRSTSGGQQQRVALARALVLNPDVLLLDEPLSNLDAKIRIQVRAEIRKLQKDLAITTIYVTHDQEEALTLSDRIAVVNQGKLQQIGSPRDLYERPENPFVADFIGINNLIPGEIQEINAAEKWMKAKTKVGVLVCAYWRPVQAGRSVHDQRPAGDGIDRQIGRGPEGIQLIAGKVSFAYYMGNTIRYDVEVDGDHPFKVDVQNPWEHQLFSIGEKVYVSFPIRTDTGDSSLRRCTA